MNPIRAFIDNITPMNATDWDFFSSKLQEKQFPKKSRLLKIGNIENHLSFIKEGITRLYIPKEENDLTFGFVFKNEFITAYDSFITQSPATYEIEALTDTSVWQISYEDLQEVYQKTVIGNTIGRKMAERMFLIKAKRELALLNKTAEERYLELFTERPELFKKIPLKYIASYIGITPQALSRIRNRIS